MRRPTVASRSFVLASGCGRSILTPPSSPARPATSTTAPLSDPTALTHRHRGEELLDNGPLLQRCRSGRVATATSPSFWRVVRSWAARRRDPMPRRRSRSVYTGRGRTWCSWQRTRHPLRAARLARCERLCGSSSGRRKSRPRHTPSAEAVRNAALAAVVLEHVPFAGAIPEDVGLIVEDHVASSCSAGSGFFLAT
jgi:hypothetical protein